MKTIKSNKWVANNYSSVFPFGKYKGFTVREVIDLNPSYILWLAENEIVDFSDDITEAAMEEDAENSPPEDFYWPTD